MKNIIVFVTVLCFALVGFTEKAMARPVPISAQEGTQLNELASNDALLTMKAGSSFPNAPKALEATEESSLKNLEEGSPTLPVLKAGDGPITVLAWVVVIVICVILLRAVNIL